MAGSCVQKYAAASVLLCLLVALNRPESIEAVYTMNETCAYIPGGYIGDPTNCQNWGYCSGGKLIQTGTCNKGLLFDTRQSMCNWASDVQCQTSVQEACQLASEPVHLPDPNNCNRYAWCSNGNTIFYSCPKYQVFNPILSRCVWAKDYQCPANSICRLVPNNIFAGDPQNCGNFIRCQDGSGISQQCSNNLKYSPLTGRCQSEYSCSSSNPGSGSTNNNPSIPATNANICIKNYVTSEATTQPTQYFSDGQTCYGFYSCSSATAIGNWGSCPFATHFDPKSQQCVSPYSVACKYNRCGNLNLSFVAQIGCQGYTVCSNQQNVDTGTCTNVNPAFQWFDEYYGSCVKDKPNQPICSATS